MNIVKNLIYFAPAGDGGTAVTLADNILNKIGTLGLIVIAGAVIIGLIVFGWGYMGLYSWGTEDQCLEGAWYVSSYLAYCRFYHDGNELEKLLRLCTAIHSTWI